MKCLRYASECKRGCTDKCAAENSYYPSNGTEGCGFIGVYCDNCLYENPHQDKEPKCEILTAVFCLLPTEPEYPGEWIERDGEPLCTKFVKWDWDTDGDPNDPDNPKRMPDPPDPRQLNLFPLYPTEVILEPIKVMV